jgi:thiol-disulfide isomerase/thioredoxin
VADGLLSSTMMPKLVWKKYTPLLLLFIICFTGFLAGQIIWDSFHLNAEQVSEEKQKYGVYERTFQTLKLTTTKSSTYELKNMPEPLVLLNFWASWCLPCLKEFPSLVEFQSKYKGKIKVIGINGDEESASKEVEKTEKKYNLNFESVIDANSAITNQFLISTYPVSLLFHRGKVIFVSKKIHNFMDKDFIQLVEDALKAEGR